MQSRIWHRAGTLAVVVGLIATLVVTLDHRDAARAAGKPNVVMITVDDMRADEMWVLPKTRALLQGTTFTNSYVSTSLCCPSRAGFLTGQYSTNNRVANNDSYKRFDHTNQLGRWMHDAGYFTSIIGKYLNGYTCTKPPQPGWDHWQALCAKYYSQYGYSIRDGNTTVRYGTSAADYQTDVVTNRAVATMDEARATGKPYFTWLTPTAPHAGAGVAPRYKTSFTKWLLPKGPSFNEADVTDKPAWVQGLPLLTTTKQKTIQAQERIRLRKLAAIDDMVEKVVENIRDAGDLGNTFIIFTSDNGYMNGEHRVLQGKEVEFDESLRVPLLVSGPGIPVGTNATPVVNTDLAASIAQLGGAAVGRAQDGESWVPKLSGPDVWGRRAIFHTSTKDKSTDADGPAHPGFFGVHAGRFSYFELSSGDRALYNHVTDPYELTNEANDPRRAAVVDQLSNVVSSLRGCAGASCHVTVPDLAPTASATYDCTGLQCTFDAGASSDPEGDVTYAWKFGDGATSTVAQPSHAFGASGTYTVELKVTDDEGVSDVFSTRVSVLANNVSPNADFTGTCTGLSCSFDGSTSFDPDGTIVAYSWAFDDGASGTGPVRNHTFAADGTYHVTLTVTDDRGGTGIVTIPFEVAAPNEPPVASFTSSCSGLTCTFDGSGSSDLDGSIVLYQWDYGDGLSEDGAVHSHIYGVHGSFTVVLRVVDNRGDVDTETVVVTV